MLINIHDIVNGDTSSINDLWIVLKRETAGPTPAVSYVSIPKDTLEYELSDDVVSEHFDIQLKVWFVVDGQNSIKFYNLKSPPKINTEISSDLLPLIRYNNLTTISKIINKFKPKVDPKQQLSDILSKANKTNLINDSVIGTKNLIYYSVYKNANYLEMLNLSILSLLKHNSSDKFDILIITDKNTKAKINELFFVSKKSPLYHITKSPKDGVEASINKIKIFDFNKINDYQNILYLDCDTASKSNIDGIFDNIKSNVLYTTYSLKTKLTELFKTMVYGFESVDDEFVKQTLKSEQYPFNAGQFLFKNSTRMREHFKNLNYFVSTWRGKYFFEQGFMNYYFCGAGITENMHLTEYIGFLSPDAIIPDKFKPITHFAGSPLNGFSKYYLMDSLFNSSLRKNNNSSFSDDNKGRKECLSIIHAKIKEAKEIKDKCYGKKNLIYYSVFFDKGYIELLDLSLKSLSLTKNINFDLLIITDKETQKKIKTLSSLTPFVCHYHIIDTPNDGVDASKTKCNVFDFEYINDYSKILFLDTDIVAVDDISNIFDKELEPEKIYSSRPFTLTAEHFKGIYHGFPWLDNKTVEEFKSNNQIGFNAGQFLFSNTERMKSHFKNIRWFMRNFPSEYFFEQCFLNYYFAKNYSIDQGLYDIVYVAHTSLERHQVFDLEPDIKLIHFTAPPLDAKTKLTYIKNNIHRYKRKEKSC